MIMSETKQCPYCGEEILATAKKCKHCGEWLTNEQQPTKQSEDISSLTGNVLKKRGKPLQIPSGSKFWGWFAGISTLSQLSRANITGEYMNLSYSLDIILFWGFLLMIQYMGNFKQKIPSLKFLPWLFLLSFLLSANLEVISTEFLTILSIGVCAFMLYIARQLSKFTEEPTGGIKTLGTFMFIGNLILYISDFLIIFTVLSVIADITDDAVDNISYVIDSISSIITYILLLRVFSKARRYNKQHFATGINHVDNNESIDNNENADSIVKEKKITDEKKTKNKIFSSKCRVN